MVWCYPSPQVPASSNAPHLRRSGYPRRPHRLLRGSQEIRGVPSGPRRRSSSRISGCVPASPSGYLRPARQSSVSCWSRPYARSQRRCCGLDRRCLFDQPRHLRSDSAVGSHGRYPELATATATAVNRRQTCRLLVTGIALGIDKLRARHLLPQLDADCHRGRRAQCCTVLARAGAWQPARRRDLGSAGR